MQTSHDAMRVLSVNVGLARPLSIDGRSVLSAIVKSACDGDVGVRRIGLEGDEQADPSVHGGLSKAVYAYASEHFDFWRTVRAQASVASWEAPIAPGLLGENLTVVGITEERLWIGDRLQLPNCVLAVSEPRLPCFNLNAALGFRHAAKLMRESAFCGSYLGVVDPGTVRAGDRIKLVPGPREVNLRDLYRARVGR